MFLIRRGLEGNKPGLLTGVSLAGVSGHGKEFCLRVN